MSLEILGQGVVEYNFPHLIWHLAIIFYLILLTGLFSVADMCSGVYTAKKTGERLRSHRYRKTIEKITWYWFFQILVAAVGLVGTLFQWYNLPYLSIAAALCICVIEGKSIWEHTKRRKDRLSKLPEILNEIIDLIGDADEVKESIKIIAKKKLAKALDNETN